MTDVVAQWARENEMILNHRKCGVIGLSPDENLFLNGHAIPNEQEYTYLGFPMSRSGINFSKFIERKCDLASRSLGLLRALGHSWDELTKLLVFKIFIRSRLEYGLPILWSYLQNHRKKDREKLWRPMEQIQLDFISWIFPSRTPARMAVINKAVLGLPAMLVRAELAALVLCERLRNCSDNLPISIFAEYGLDGTVHHSRRRLLLLKNIAHIGRFSEYTAAVSDPSNQISTLRGFARQVVRDSFRNTTNQLPLCIFPGARFKGWSYDSAVRLTRTAERTFALKWRRNTWQFDRNMQRYCHLHDGLFNRGCLSNCGILDAWEPGCGVLERLKTDFQSFKDNNSTPRNYNMVDHILNRKLYHVLPSLMEYLDIMAPLVSAIDMDNSDLY